MESSVSQVIRTVLRANDLFELNLDRLAANFKLKKYLHEQAASRIFFKVYVTLFQIFVGRDETLRDALMLLADISKIFIVKLQFIASLFLSV